MEDARDVCTRDPRCASGIPPSGVAGPITAMHEVLIPFPLWF